MKTKKTIIAWVALCAFAFCTLTLKADNTPKWKINLSEAGISKPSKMQQLESGVIVLQNSKTVFGIDPTTQAVLWKYDLGIETVKSVEGTNLLTLSYSNNINPRIILIDYVTGTEILDTKDDEVRFESSFALKEINMLFIEATNGKLKRKYLYGINTQEGTLLWTKEIGEGSSNARNLFRTVGVSVANYKNMVLDSEKQVIFTDGKKVRRLNPTTGDVLWEVELKYNVTNVRAIPDEKILCVTYIGLNVLELIDISDGSLLLPNPIKTKGEFRDFIPYKGKYIVKTTDGLNIFDFKTKTFDWQKFPSTGSVSRFRIFDNGFLTINESQQDYSYVYFVDTTGKKVWSRHLGKLVAYDVCEQGIFYVSKDNANIMSFETGKNIWDAKKNIYTTGTAYFHYNAEAKVLTMLAETKLIWSVLPDLSLFNVSLDSGDYKLISDKIAFKDKDGIKESVGITETEDGYALYTAQNLMLVNKEGAITYNKNYPIAGSFVSVPMQQKGLKSIAMGALFGVPTEVKYQSGVATGIRKTATAATNDYLFIMTECHTPENKLYPCLLTVEKTTGQEVSNIALTDMSPVYLVDAMNQMVYLLSDTELVCYAL